MRVSVCINTFHRPADLRRLLGDLAAQGGPPGIAEVVVTDNDAAGSARATVEALMAQVPFALVYQIEPEQSISLTRNRGVHRASGDWIGFLDDDERVAPDWLALREPADGFDPIALCFSYDWLPTLDTFLAKRTGPQDGHARRAVAREALRIKRERRAAALEASVTGGGGAG